MNFKSRGLVLWLALIVPACAQYPGHVEKAKKPAAIVRSIAVLEWTGEMGKPKASRIIPISVFDGEEYQPGGLYLAKPEPLALEPGTEYVLQDAGIARGLFDVNSAQDVEGYWFGYGKWKPMISPPKKAKAKQGLRMPQVVTDAGDGRPHFKGRGPGESQDNSAPAGSSPAPASQPAPNNPPSGDPDRPTLRRRTDSSDSTPSATTTTDTAAPETAIGGGDPDRPHIAHGQQTPTDDVPAQLTGVPSELQQMIAVSDANDREVHPFVYLWADPSDATKMQAAMEAAASDAISAAQPAAKTTPRTTTTKSRTAGSTAPHHRTSSAPPSAKPVFTNVHFKAFELTYSGGATLVYSAETTDHAGKTKYITLIAQPDFNGVPKVLFKSLTDDDHLEQTPRMRLVDAVDARANNRGDLIFELRRRRDREFVIYRISGGLAEQVFTTGSLANSVSQS